MKLSKFKICPACGADCDPQSKHCWICKHNMAAEPLVVQAEALKHPSQQSNDAAFIIVTSLLMVTGGLIGVGLAMEEIGLAIIYGIVAVPSLLATLVSLSRRKPTGELSWFSWILRVLTTLMISTAATVGIIMLLILSAVVAVIGFCAVMWS